MSIVDRRCSKPYVEACENAANLYVIHTQLNYSSLYAAKACLDVKTFCLLQVGVNSVAQWRIFIAAAGGFPRNSPIAKLALRLFIMANLPTNES